LERKAALVLTLALMFIDLLTLSLNIQQVEAEGAIYIKSDGSINPSTTPIQREGSIYTFTDNIYETIVVQKANVIIDGNGYMLQGAGSNNGFDLVNINNVTIRKTRIKGFDYGIRIYKSSGNTVSGNILTENNLRAIFVSNSSDNIISRNQIVNNVGEGTFLWLTNNTVVASNNVSNNGEDGISIGYSSFYNTIVNNTVSNNNGAGVSLGFEISTSNVIMGNTVSNHYWTGIFVESSSGNTFYHNNLLHNTNQIVTIEATNTWDNGYPSSGNYWSDYTGTDANGDGIGDTQYTIDATNIDRYPLMGPFNTFDAGTWNGVAYHVDVVSNSTVSAFAFNPERTPEISFNATGSLGTTGFCRVSIPKQLLKADYPKRWLVLVSGRMTIPTILEDANYTYLYLTYNHSTKTTQIIIQISILGDLDGDGYVGPIDLNIFAANYGKRKGQTGYNPLADLDMDGYIGPIDLNIFAANYGKTI